jgi:hypothetical protein
MTRIIQFGPPLLLSLVAVCCETPALAQAGYLWAPHELTAKADIIAIVEVIGWSGTVISLRAYVR